MSEPADREDENLKNVTIRGIDARIYEQFAQRIKMSEMNIGEAVTSMMEDIIRNFDDVFPELSAESLRKEMKLDTLSIRHQNKLSISKKDLEETGKTVSFHHITFLRFEEDVTKELFTTYVNSIHHCKRVELPNILPKLMVLSKIHHTDEIEIYEVET